MDEREIREIRRNSTKDAQLGEERSERGREMA